LLASKHVATGGSPSPKRDVYVPKHGRKRSASAGKTKTKPGAKGPSTPTKRSFLRRRWWLLLLLTPLVLALLALGGLYIAYARITLPDALPPIQTTYLYDRNGHLLTTLHGSVDRTVVELSQISPHMIDAVIATEDHAFYDHPGIDVTGIARAAYTDLVKRDTIQGASTLTEQLVKQVYAGSYETDADGVRTYVPPERSVPEKIREALLAVKLEQQLGKDEILAQYLNTVYFGHGAYGVEAAAQTYFGEHASQLTILESASLAGVLHAPELYDPIDRPSDNWFRRNYAIDQMTAYGYLDPTAATELKDHECCGTVNNDSAERLVSP
jgi:membrane peptidoglycan carboxypeptidase